MNKTGKVPAPQNLQYTQTRPPVKPPINTLFKVTRPEQAQGQVAVTFLKMGELGGRRGESPQDAKALHLGPALWKRERQDEAWSQQEPAWEQKPAHPLDQFSVLMGEAPVQCGCFLLNPTLAMKHSLMCVKLQDHVYQLEASC